MTNTTPAIIFKSTFKIHSDTIKVNNYPKNIKYENYINYMDREDAKFEREEDVTLDDYHSGNRILEYVGDRLKTNNVFNNVSNDLSKDELNDVIQKFNVAQKNQSPMWQNVFSFDNEFLKEQSFLDENNNLDDTKLKQATRQAMDILIKEMKFNETVNWVGAIHYNTENIHIHIAMVETESSRETIAEGKYAGQKKAKIPKKVLRKTKSAFANQLIDRSNELRRMDYLSRELIRNQINFQHLQKKYGIARDIKELLKVLPDDRRKWRYGMNDMKDKRPLIDNITGKIIDKFYKDEFNELENLWKQQDTLNSRLYGETSNNYYQNKKAELHQSIGNLMLTNLRKEYPNIKNRNQNNHYEPTEKVLKEAVYNVKRILYKNKQDYLNEISFNKTKRQVEQEKEFEYENE